jgi:hypothetical protein
MFAAFMKETINRSKQMETTKLSHTDIRQQYTKGTRSIKLNMPVPLAKLGGTEYDQFAIFSVQQAEDHLLAHVFPLTA